MPRKPIDYSNTIIYKICCNDPNITDVYVGHTTNFTKRKGHHKNSCNNENSVGYNLYIYQFIRKNGGWLNWSMIELEKINCIDVNEACKNERRYFELLGATLNIKVPSRTPTEYRIDNDDKIKQGKQKYYEENTDKILEYQKKYYEENTDKIKQGKQKYYEENTDKIKEHYRKYREENKDKIKEHNHKYREENKDKINERKRELRKQLKLKTDKLVDV
jgi:hypothetical protein